MKDINRFKKLFGIKTPCEEHFDYYISVLSRTYKYSDIYENIKLYEEAESQFDNFNDWSHKKSNEIIDYLKSTATNKKLSEGSINKVSYNKKPYKGEFGKKYLSIDLVQANWQVFKMFDDSNELPGTYDELLDKFGCPEVLKRSKNYRQFIFGNLNPKRYQTIQVSIMQSIALLMETEGIKYTVVDLKHDELIITDYDESVYDYINSRKYKFRMEEFIPTMVDNVRIREFYELGTDKLLYKKLFTSNGNRLYMDIKKYILEEPLELRDLYFRDNGELALWSDDKELLKSLL